MIMAHKYTKEQADFIRDNITGKAIPELTQLFNSQFRLELTCSQIRSCVGNRGLKSGIKKQPLKKHKYTAEHIDFLVSVIPDHSYQEIIKLFYERFKIQLSFNQIKCFIGNRKLNTGRTGCFPKGHTPFNKGKKGLTTGGVQTQFKKGHMPHNHLPVGSERVRTSHPERRTKDDYIDVKVAEPNKWRGKHIVIWEEHNGPVPKGHAVIFGDGDNRNFDPNNLILVSRKQLAILNKKKLIQNDADLTRTAVIITDISLKIREKQGRR